MCEVQCVLWCAVLQSEEEAQEKRFEWQRSDRVPPKAECVQHLTRMCSVSVYQ